MEGPHLGGDISIHTSAGIDDTHPTHCTNPMIYASNFRVSSIFSSLNTLCASHNDREFISLSGLMILPIGMGIDILQCNHPLQSFNLILLLGIIFLLIQWGMILNF